MLNTEWTQVEVLELFDQDGAASSAACFGFSILGGKSTGVVVKSITPGSISDLDGRLHCGDHILYVGTICVRGLSAEQVAAVLRQQTRGFLQLIVARQVVNPQTPSEDAYDADADADRLPRARLPADYDLSHSHFRSGPGGYCSAKAPIILTHQLDDYLRVLLKRLADGEREAENDATVASTDDRHVPHDDEDDSAPPAAAQRVPSASTPDNAGTTIQQVLIVSEKRERAQQNVALQPSAILPLAAAGDTNPTVPTVAMDTTECLVLDAATVREADVTLRQARRSVNGEETVTLGDLDGIKRRSVRECDEALANNGQDGFIELFDVDLQLAPGDAGFGIRVAGYLGHVGGVDLCGIFVKSLIRGSPAARDGRIHVNDQLIGVNGTMLTDVPNHMALQLLRSSGQSVCLRLARHKRGPIFEQLSKLVDNTPPLFAPAPDTNASSTPCATLTPTPTPTPTPVSALDVVRLNGNGLSANAGHVAWHNEPIMQSPASKKTKHEATTASNPTLELDTDLQRSIAYWRSLVGSQVDIIVAQLTLTQQTAERRTPACALGCSIQTATIRDDAASRTGRTVRPQPLRSKRHFITELTPTGAVARDGRLRIGDEILEINGKVACGRNSDYVLGILNEVQNTNVRLLCARRRRGSALSRQEEDASSTTDGDGSWTHRESSIVTASASGESDSTDTERFADSTTDEWSSSVAARRRRPLVVATPRSCASASSRLVRCATGASDRRNVSYSQLASDDYADYDEDSGDDEDAEDESITPTASDTETDATDFASRSRSDWTSPRAELSLYRNCNARNVLPNSTGSRSRLLGSAKSKSDTNLAAPTISPPACSSVASSTRPPSSAAHVRPPHATFSPGVTELRRSQKLAATGSRYAQYAAIRFRKEVNARRARTRSGGASVRAGASAVDRVRSAPLTASASTSSFARLALPRHVPAQTTTTAASAAQQSYFNLIPLELLATPAYRSHSLQPLIGMALWMREPSVIELQRPCGTAIGLGFSVIEHRDPFNPLKPVIVVRSLVPGGVADLDGRLTPGDRLLFVNQVRLEELNSFDAVLRALRSIPPGPVRIGFCKPLPLAAAAATLAAVPVYNNAALSPQMQPAPPVRLPLRSNGTTTPAVNGDATTHDDTITQTPAGAFPAHLTAFTLPTAEQCGLPEPPVELLKSSSSSDDSSVPSSMTVSTISENRAPLSTGMNGDDEPARSTHTTSSASAPEGPTTLASGVSSRPSSSSISTCATTNSNSHSKLSSVKRQRGTTLQLAEPPPLELTESDVEILERLKRVAAAQQQVPASDVAKTHAGLPPAHIKVCLSCKSTEPHAVGTCAPKQNSAVLRAPSGRSSFADAQNRNSQLDTPIRMPIQQTDCGTATFSASFVATIGDESVPIQVFLCDRCVRVQAVKPATPHAFYSFLQTSVTDPGANSNGSALGTSGEHLSPSDNVHVSTKRSSSEASSTQNLTSASTVSTVIGESANEADSDLRVFQV